MNEDIMCKPGDNRDVCKVETRLRRELESFVTAHNIANRFYDSKRFQSEKNQEQIQKDNEKLNSLLIKTRNHQIECLKIIDEQLDNLNELRPVIDSWQAEKSEFIKLEIGKFSTLNKHFFKYQLYQRTPKLAMLAW